MYAIPEPATRSFTVLETRTSPGSAAATRAPIWTAIPPIFVRDHLALTGMQTAAHFEAERSHFVTNTARTANRAGRPIECRKQAVEGSDRLRFPTGREAYPCFASILVTMTLVRSRTLALLCIGTLEKQLDVERDRTPPPTRTSRLSPRGSLT